jgi:radical SAM-linked protein
MVPQNEIIPIRIKFKKYGSLMYVSHLDTAKTMQRIMLRAGIDIWYTEGFNPQPKIVFAVPLPVGVESECEFMDIKINSFMSCEEIASRLSANFPDEMKIIDVYVPEVKLKNIIYIDYEMEITSPNVGENTANEIEALLSNDVYVIKKSKGTEKEINVRDYIKSVSVKNEDGRIKIYTVLCGGGDKNINPELVIEAIRSNTNLLNSSPIEEYYSIMRKRMLCEDLTEFK